MDTPVMNDMPFNGAQHSSLGSSLGISQLSPSLILSMGDRGLRSEGAPGAGSGLGGGFLFEHLTEGGESVLSRLYVWVRVRVRVRVRMRVRVRVRMCVCVCGGLGSGFLSEHFT
jgi:hypothetical protein